MFLLCLCRLLGLEIDTPVANIAAKVALALTGGVSSEAKASIEVLLDSIRSSKMWPIFTKMLQDSGVSYDLRRGLLRQCARSVYAR